jgi:carbon monoxide dehydrogenase subunit G
LIRIDKEAIIRAPLKDVFRYVREPGNWLEIWPGLLQVDNLQELVGGGFSGRFQYKMAGMTFQGKGEFTEFIPDRWFVVNTRGTAQSTITCTFRAFSEEKTRITLTIDYEVPIPLLGRLAEYVIKKMNDQEADLVLANLQARLTQE